LTVGANGRYLGPPRETLESLLRRRFDYLQGTVSTEYSVLIRFYGAARSQLLLQEDIDHQLVLFREAMYICRTEYEIVI